ncbi:MAG TPA: DUF6491 family protein [Azospirillaceae bacterium]|nr:DUF6491 family protein [Azospirillaceae bacterium]
MTRTRAVPLHALILGAALLAALPALAQDKPPPELPPRESLGAGNDCTWARTIDDWQAVDREHIIIKGPSKRDRFLVRFGGACTMSDPKFESQIGIQSSDERLCPYGGDALLLDGERCTILNMWKLPPEGQPSATVAPSGG